MCVNHQMEWDIMLFTVVKPMWFQKFPHVVDIVLGALDDNQWKVIKTVLLSNSTVLGRLNQYQWIHWVAGPSVLVAFVVRYMYNYVEEKMLMYKISPTHMFNLFPLCMVQKGLRWKHGDFCRELEMFLDKVVKILNFINSRSVNLRIFITLCDAVGSSCTTLLLIVEVQWLLQGRVFVCILTLNSYILLFSTEHFFQLSSCLCGCSRADILQR
jgi:hypothetical protein